MSVEEQKELVVEDEEGLSSIFESKKKKKSSKKVKDVSAEDESAPAEEGENEDISSKKKKKSKSTEPAPETEEVANEDELPNFETKKKKKKSKSTEESTENAEQPEGEEAEGEEDFSSILKSKKKKTSKKSKKTDEAEEEGDQNNNESADALPNYTYLQLLQRISSMRPGGEDRARFTINPPQLMRVGTKKTLWTNFEPICTAMNRSTEHVFQFILAELGTEGSIDATNRLVIRGKFAPKYIESLLRKYVMEYVVCQMCREFKTSLNKDPISRLHFVSCMKCGSTRSVAQIRAGFHAQTRADRRALRNA